MDKIAPRRASTIVVIRDKDSALEILMLRRTSQRGAAPGSYVFPGGAVDEVDADAVREGLVSGIDDARAARLLGLAIGALEYYGAGLRELFEEAGILLVVDDADHRVDVASSMKDEWRTDLGAQRVTWPELLHREGLRLAGGELEYLAHWVTPEGRVRRFDTRFFVARSRLAQEVRVDGEEIVEHVWTSASGALARHESGEWAMLVPTVRTLRAMTSYHDVHSVLLAAAHTPVERIQPREIERDGRTVIVVPGDVGYDESP